jgi:hypothetical protein
MGEAIANVLHAALKLLVGESAAEAILYCHAVWVLQRNVGNAM